MSHSEYTLTMGLTSGEVRTLLDVLDIIRGEGASLDRNAEVVSSLLDETIIVLDKMGEDGLVNWFDGGKALSAVEEWEITIHLMQAIINRVQSVLESFSSE